MKDGILITEADHPGWAQMFLMRKKGILRKINNIYPQLKIKNIKIRYKDTIISPNRTEKIEEIKSMPKMEVKNEANDKDFFSLLDKFKERADK